MHLTPTRPRSLRVSVTFCVRSTRREIRQRRRPRVRLSRCWWGGAAEQRHLLKWINTLLERARWLHVSQRAECSRCDYNHDEYAHNAKWVISHVWGVLTGEFILLKWQSCCVKLYTCARVFAWCVLFNKQTLIWYCIQEVCCIQHKTQTRTHGLDQERTKYGTQLIGKVYYNKDADRGIAQKKRTSNKTIER